MNTRPRWQLMVGVLIVVVFFAAVWLVGGSLLQTEVSVASVDRGTAVNAVPGVVGIHSARSVELRVEVGGQLVESTLELGATVEAGDVVVRLNDVDLRRALERVEIDLEAERALADLGSLFQFDLLEAKEELARRERDNGRFSDLELDAQRRRVARLESEIRREAITERRRVRSLENELERLEEELKKTVLRAPVGGHVVEIFAHPGDVVAPRAPVVRILSRDRVVEATLSEENIAGVVIGQPATVRFLSYGSRLFSGQVAKVLPAADPATQRYTIHLDVDMPEELMVPGITGEVSIVLGQREEALTIPRRALLGRDVFVVRDGRVELRQVERGFISLNQVEVLGGLEAGEHVAVENLDRLRDGDPVRVKNHVP